jgi:hypothetical protein
MIPHRDSSSRSGLSGEGEAADVLDAEFLLQPDRPADLEDDGARYVGILRTDRLPQAALAAVVQIGDVVDIPAAPALGEAPVAFGPGKGGQGRPAS